MIRILQLSSLAKTVKHVTLYTATTALLTMAGAVEAVEINFGGYVKVDAIYDLDQDLGSTLRASDVDTTPGASSETSYQMHAKQTRLNVKAAEGDVMVFVESDFFGGDGTELVSNSHHLRLRHAYGKMGNFLAGQTWSTFMDANWLVPTTVDFDGSAGVANIRQAQFRWTIKEGLDFAIENPENLVDDGVAGDHRDTLPDVILRYASSGDFSWQVAGLFQQFEADSGPADGQSTNNLGASAGIHVATGSGSISAQMNLNANRYSYYGWANPLAVVSGGNVEVIDHTTVVLAYIHDWGGDSGAKTTVAYGNIAFDDAFLAGADIDSINTLHINYRWNPYEKVMYAAEISRAAKELVNGDDGDAVRLQFAVQYNF